MNDFYDIWTVSGAVIGIIALVALLFAYRARRRKMKREKNRQAARVPARQDMDAQGGSIGKLHNIGRRKDQQDSFGIMPTPGGQFAVVADGMGGLSGGDRVSQQVVMSMLQDASALGGGADGNVLFEMVAHANSIVNSMLGAADAYVSGSTVVAVLVEYDCFHWVSVGDSRICLYRNGRLIQLNREHTYEAELMVQAVNGEISFEEAAANPKRAGLTSFIGMGELKYIDGSHRGVQIQRGDRLLLMTDGVFNTLTEEDICRILGEAGCAENAASAMQERILSYGRENQDNFTAVIIDL